MFRDGSRITFFFSKGQNRNAFKCINFSLFFYHTTCKCPIQDEINEGRVSLPFALTVVPILTVLPPCADIGKRSFGQKPIAALKRFI